MKKRKTDIKKTIQKKIELKQEQYRRHNTNVKMIDRDAARLQGGVRKDKAQLKLSKAKMMKVALMSDRDKLRNFGTTNIVEDIAYPIKNFGKYVPNENVDCDVIIYIASINRFEKVHRLLTQLFTQETKYTFKVILMNDGSDGDDYQTLSESFPELIYLENEVSGGKAKYWQTTNTMWAEANKYKTHALIQIDDDFILCKNFLNIIMDKFFTIKNSNNSYMAIRYHYGHKDSKAVFPPEFWDHTERFQSLDGGCLFDTQFMKLIEYKIPPVDPNIFKGKHADSRVWYTLNKLVKELGILVYTTRKSLALHDGNDVSMMHSQSRYNNGIYTKYFIDNESGNDI